MRRVTGKKVHPTPSRLTAVTAPFTPSGADYTSSKRYAGLPASFEGASTGVVETARHFTGGGMEGWASLTYIM